MGTRFIAGGLNITAFRLILSVVWIRLFLRREVTWPRWTHIDRAFISFVFVSSLTYILLWSGDVTAIKYKTGQAYDSLGFYFFFRITIKGWPEASLTLRTGALLCIPLALLILAERWTGVNSFAALGGVPYEVTVRDGTLRCQGPFSHPILAGTFGAAMVTWSSALLFDRSTRLTSLLGALAAGAIVIAAGSSGPLMACAAGVAALSIWSLRAKMNLIRIALVALVLVLHFAMQAPIWFLVARASVYNASTGYHRAFLIDRTIANVGEWWLLGTRRTEHWGTWLFDITNQYILVCVTGGIFSFALFIILISLLFRSIGITRRHSQVLFTSKEWFIWAAGASIVVHLTSFLSVSYFDQNTIMWHLLLAMISSLQSCAPRYTGKRSPSRRHIIHSGDESKRAQLCSDIAFS
jgi:hypothetical protein